LKKFAFIANQTIIYYIAAVKELAGMSKSHMLEVLTLIEKLKREESGKKLSSVTFRN